MAYVTGSDYRILKRLAQPALNLSTTNPEADFRVIRALKIAAQTRNATRDYQSDLYSILANINANHDVLNDRFNENASRRHAEYKDRISDMSRSVENHIKKREDIAEEEKASHEKRTALLKEIATALQSGDQSKADRLFNQMDNAEDKLRQDIKTLDNAEKELTRDLEQLRSEVSHAVTSVSLTPVKYEGKPKPSLYRPTV